MLLMGSYWDHRMLTSTTTNTGVVRLAVMKWSDTSNNEHPSRGVGMAWTTTLLTIDHHDGLALTLGHCHGSGKFLVIVLKLDVVHQDRKTEAGEPSSGPVRLRV